jgi:hypothetical protein
MDLPPGVGLRSRHDHQHVSAGSTIGTVRSAADRHPDALVVLSVDGGTSAGANRLPQHWTGQTAGQFGET